MRLFSSLLYFQSLYDWNLTSILYLLTEAVGVLDVDWNELPTKKHDEAVTTTNGDAADDLIEAEESSVLKRFTPGKNIEILLCLIVSTK